MGKGSLVARLPALAPALFVLLWATGFIGAKLGLPYAEPFTFLLLRFLLVLAIMVPAAFALQASWPAPKTAAHVAVVGLLVHGVYLGGVFAAIARGMPAGISALIVSLQPLLTATLAGPLLGERVTRRQIAGLLLGLFGVALVLSGKLAPAGGNLFGGFGVGALLLCLAALLGITGGLVYQKRYCVGVDLRSGAVIQYAAAAAMSFPLALLFESFRVEWTPSFLFALSWLVLVLSVGAVTLLMVLVRLGESARTASFFYLVPPVTALMAWLLFDERLELLALLGMAVAVLGVALVVVPARRPKADGSP